MYIALRDLWFAKGRFLLMAAVVGLLAMLMVLLTGLSTGLAEDNVSGIANLPATHLAFNAEAGVAFNRSAVDQSAWTAFQGRPGITAAAPLGNALANGQAYRDPAAADTARAEVIANGRATTRGVPLDVTLFGVEPGSFIAPTPSTGQPLGTTPNGVLVSQGLVDKHDVSIGDRIVLDQRGTVLEVVGTTGPSNFGHAPVVWLPLALWQEVAFGPVGGPVAGQELPDVATVVAIDATSGADLAAADAAAGTTTVTRKASFAGSPGYKEETGTLIMIKCFLYAIAALLVAAFFTVWTIQRRQEIGLMKALGASTGYVLKDSLGQALLVLVGATLVGTVLGIGLGAAIPNGAPFSLAGSPIALASVLVIAMGAIGAGLSIRRIAKVDPLIALGGSR